MHAKQRTINQSVSLTGTGLHTGNKSTITFHPAPVGYGYKFIRTDLEKHFEIPALVEYVTDLSRGTTLGKDDISVHTVEHVLASLAGLQIDNCRIELSANEPPVIDGSSMPYVEVLLKAGIVEQEEPREYFIVDETTRYLNDEKGVDIVALPTDDYRITVMIDYYNPALGSQHTGMFNLEKEFVKEFAPARTFCFLTEIEMLYRQGLIKGGTLDTAVVIVDKEIEEGELNELKEMFNLPELPIAGTTGILNDSPLRFKNEPARHKLLDMLGDLALIGVPIKAQILAARPGHASNIEFAKKIRNLYLKKKSLSKYKVNSKNGAMLDIYDLLKVMPHRYPFLLIDRVVDIDSDKKTVVAYKNVTFNEPYFNGHFPEKPIMPGVLIIEAMAQTGCLYLWNTLEDISEKLVYFMAVKNAKFRKPVIPGDQLVMEVEMTGKRFNAYMFKGNALVDGQIVAECEFQAALVDRTA
ncbi:MAG: UDP-3-O-[3-hydroxymyristoyl] N-acetylglucosamine deacetylase [Ignavibacteria bacterium]|nr:UDP-3-O-[3-hydroxymyristoyl] N-acetylglucosamine deacetylase [Ignavibacteria bacterium]